MEGIFRDMALADGDNVCGHIEAGRAGRDGGQSDRVDAVPGKKGYFCGEKPLLYRRHGLAILLDKGRMSQ
jgi:hypothetical protein